MTLRPCNFNAHGSISTRAEGLFSNSTHGLLATIRPSLHHAIMLPSHHISSSHSLSVPKITEDLIEKGYLPPETKQRMEGEKLLSSS